MSSMVGKRQNTSALALRFMLGGLLWALPLLAHAERVAALLPAIAPNPSAIVQERFQEAVSRGFIKPGRAVLDPVEVRKRLSIDPVTRGCSQAGPCLGRVADLVGAEELISARIGISGKSYRISLRLFDRQGKELGRSE
jgi:hypothetical protein